MSRTATNRSATGTATAKPAGGAYPATSRDAGRTVTDPTPDYSQEAERMVQDLGAVPATGTRDVGPDVAAPAGALPAIDPNDPELQRSLWGPLFQVVGPAVVAAVDALAGQQRAAGLPEADADQRVRDLTSFLTTIGPKLWDLVPEAIETLTRTAAENRGLPAADDDEAQSRWIFPLISALAPVVIPAVTDMINGLVGHRDVGPDGASSEVSLLRGELGATVGRDLFGSIFGGIVQVLPTVFTLLGGQSRDTGLTLDSFPTRTYDGDFINMVVSDLGDPSMIEISLSQPYNTWWKQIELMAGDSVIQAMWCQDGRHDDGPVRIPVTQLRRAGHLRFSKAKFWGVHTAMYDVYDLDKKAGKSLHFEWLDD